MARLNRVVAAVAWLGLAGCIPAFGQFVAIPIPSAVYTGSTTVIPITVADGTSVPSLTDGTQTITSPGPFGGDALYRRLPPDKFARASARQSPRRARNGLCRIWGLPRLPRRRKGRIAQAANWRGRTGENAWRERRQLNLVGKLVTHKGGASSVIGSKYGSRGSIGCRYSK